MPDDLPSSTDYYSYLQELQEKAQVPVKLKLKYTNPLEATSSYTSSNIYTAVDKVSWGETNQLVLETKLGFVPWIITRLTVSPQEMVLETPEGTITGKDQILRYLEAKGLSTKVTRPQYKNTIPILALNVNDRWIGIPWNLVQGKVIQDYPSDQRETILHYLENFGELRSSNPDLYQDLLKRIMADDRLTKRSFEFLPTEYTREGYLELPREQRV